MDKLGISLSAVFFASTLAASTLVAGTLVSGCGDDKNTTSDIVDSGIPVAIDAMAPEPDAEPNYCTLLESSYGDLGALPGTAEVGPQDSDTPLGPRLIKLRIPLNQDTNPDVLVIELWENDGVFLDGYSAKTIVLIANQADLFECSACVFIAADFVVGQSTNFNMTYSGQLIIDAIDPAPDTGRIQGSLTNLKLRAVTIDSSGQEVTAMGCKTTLESITFDYPMTLAPVANE
ncbi:MAG: hypothetical protein JKY56_12085 [Kofleriaceae bacterium]|nr:hypothetical protein [Kofleriaceae bacterium]